MGDKLLPRLNIYGKPIANKYCEGKMKRTLKRESKDLKSLRGSGRNLFFGVDLVWLSNHCTLLAPQGLLGALGETSALVYVVRQNEVRSPHKFGVLRVIFSGGDLA